MKRDLTRTIIIKTLDDDNGVSNKAYQKMEKVCMENGWDDIIDAVKETEGRWYLPENHGLK